MGIFEKIRLGSRVIAISKTQPFSPNELLGMMRAMADVCRILNKDATGITKMLTQKDLITENCSLKKQVALLEDQIELLADNVDISDLTGDINE